MKYRREIDGLRALAVFPVIMFHAGFEAFSGGFLGVDIFFVISGYLITTIILSEKQQNTFTLTGFYERRARRILPALYLMMFICLPLAWQYLFPSDFKIFSTSLMKVATFASNFFFRTQVNYFLAPSDLFPLLHTWSLAVEEQFYVLFPIFLLLTWELGKLRTISLLVVIAIFSLVFADLGSLYFPAATFYLLPTRAWEFLIGTFAAYFLLNKGNFNSNKFLSESMSALGLAAIVFAIFYYDRDTPYSTLFILIPTLGTAGIIFFCTPKIIIGKLLGNKVLVGIGLISYSAYLWHQPLFAFARHSSINELSTPIRVMISCLTLLLAYLSWRFVEKPFRDRHFISRKTIFILSALGAFLFVAIGQLGTYFGGFENRFSSKTNALLNAYRWQDFENLECNSKTDINLYCLGNRENIIGALLGDSHSQALALELDKALNSKRLGMEHFIGVPIFNAYEFRYKRKGFKNISDAEKIYQHIHLSKNIQYVVLSSRWTIMLEETRFNNGEGGLEHYIPYTREIMENGKLVRHSKEKREQLMSKNYKTTITRYLQLGKKIFLIYPVPEVGWNVRTTLAKLKMNLDNTDLSTSHELFKSRNKKVYDIFDSIGEHPNLVRIKPEELLCDTFIKNRCATHFNGKPFYDDDDHLSSAATSWVVNRIVRHIPPTLNTGSDNSSPAPSKVHLRHE